ncbi:FAD-dependent oxidoreductase [Streptomyces sp. NPDC127068]|uniref:oxidoreductase n=1 Tax=Streptomyces sp. NPDC127068 TaxID=3347127 RepID=UPI00365D3A19
MLDHVFRPGAIGGLRLPHRVVMGAMHLNLETLDDGGASLAAFYAERVRGGAGLIVTGGTAVSPEGAGGPGYAIVGEPAHEGALRRTAEEVHAAGGQIALQLFHAGRYALPGAPGTDGGPGWAPSPVACRFTRTTPRELSDARIRSAIEDFARAAGRAVKLGFDAVEVMGSEGYLINQFTAPLTNTRTDGWGGDAERRRRFAVAVAKAVREAVGASFPVLFRMSGVDLIDGGTPREDVDALAGALARAGVDALAVGIGWHESPVPTVQARVPTGTWAAYAKNVKRALRAAGHGALPVLASNRYSQLTQVDAVLADGEVDFVALARPFLADPAIVAKSRAGHPDTVNVCLACNQACIDRSFGTERVSCLVNPRSGYEREFPVAVRAQRGRYAVIGAGPAGLQAARTLGQAGQDVEVLEAETEPGGQFRWAALVPGKEVFGETVRHHVGELAQLGVTLRLGYRVGGHDLTYLRGFDGIVLATGVRGRRPDLPGLALPQVFSYQRAFADPDALGHRIAIIGGGGIGVDLAHFLTADPGLKRTPEAFLARYALTTTGAGPASASVPDSPLVPRASSAPSRRVTVVCRGRRIGAGIGASTRWVVLDELRTAGVRLLTATEVEEITRPGVWVQDANGGRELIPADHVVLATGQEPEREVAAELRRAGVPFEAAGGAAGTGSLNAARATAEGLRAAHRLLDGR